MRAFCHKNGDFRDFLLSRILEVETRYADQERSHEDHAWHHIVQLVLAPHPQLKAAHRGVIELDYGMRGGQCFLECRQALLFYVLQQLGLLEEGSAKSAEAQQIVLKNREKLAEFLPKTQHR
jgi:predicted DNA-binding transcriptional regulator YafY